MFNKYIREDLKRYPKAFWYQQLIDLVDGNLFCCKEEQAIINKFKPLILKIKPKELMMELKEIKVFANEVGLSAKDIKGMEMDDIIVEVIRNIDPEKKYSKEFIAWYEELPDEYIDAADSGEAVEKETNNNTNKEAEEMNVEEVTELLEALDDLSKKDELLEVIGDYPEVFEGLDVSGLKLVTQVKKAMKEHLKGIIAGNKEPASDEDMEELVEAINSAENVAELKEIAEMEDFASVFKGIKFREGKGRGAKDRDLEVVQSEMLKCLNVDVEDTEETVDDNSEDPMAEYVEMDDKELKAAAKEMGIKVKIGMKRDAILAAVAEMVCEPSEEEEEEEVEITPEMVDEAIEADDKDTLLEICDAMGIELKTLEKRSVKIMGKKIKESLGTPGKGAPEKHDKEDTDAPAGEKASVMQVIEEMVNAGAKEKDIVKAVTPLYEEMGKKSIFIKKHVSQVVALLEALN